MSREPKTPPSPEKLYAQKHKLIAKLQTETAELMLSLFNEKTKQLFQDHPTLAAFRWTQYTPYFNDGDPCYFGANTEYPDVKFRQPPSERVIRQQTLFDVSTENTDDEECDVEDWEDSYDIDYTSHTNPEKQSALTAVRTLLNKFCAEDYERLFGDHRRVTVTPNEIIEDDYDHD